MITPAIDLGTGNTYNLEYDVAWTEYAQTTNAVIGVDDTVHVVISTDGGATFPRSNIVASYHQGNPVDAAGTRAVHQLSGYNGIVHIGFYTTSTVSNEDTDFFIDDIEVAVQDKINSFERDNFFEFEYGTRFEKLSNEFLIFFRHVFKVSQDSSVNESNSFVYNMLSML